MSELRWQSQHPFLKHDLTYVYHVPLSERLLALGHSSALGPEFMVNADHSCECYVESKVVRSKSSKLGLT